MIRRSRRRDPQHIPYAAVGHFRHAPGLLDATYQDVGCPNNDTLYSFAWIDLTAEPGDFVAPRYG